MCSAVSIEFNVFSVVHTSLAIDSSWASVTGLWGAEGVAITQKSQKQIPFQTFAILRWLNFRITFRILFPWTLGSRRVLKTGSVRAQARVARQGSPTVTIRRPNHPQKYGRTSKTAVRFQGRTTIRSSTDRFWGCYILCRPKVTK